MQHPAQAHAQELVSSHAIGVVICIPVFNDWDCVLRLLEGIDAAAGWAGDVRVLLVDDASNSETYPTSLPHRFKRISKVQVLELRCNLGHQRAIVLGLAFIDANLPGHAIIVMDGDGEDSPNDIVALLAECRRTDYFNIVFAKRRRRTEGLVFRFGYGAYRLLHRILTGRRVDVGNFSFIPQPLVRRVVAIPETWNHYAAGVFHARLPICMIPLDRARRYAGRSKMNFVSLVVHGMSAISVYGDIVGVRLLCATAGVTCLAFAALIAVVLIRAFTDLAIPGWATTVFGSICVVLINLIMSIMVFVLFILQSRRAATFIPFRDWRDYVARETTIYDSDV